MSNEKAHLISSLNKDYETIKSENPNPRSSTIYCSHGKNAKYCCGNLEVSLELDSPDDSNDNSMSNQRLDKLVLSHCHSLTAESGVDRHARKRLIFASILCVVFMIGEVIGGFLANSLAIATDAAHLLTDFASFMISLFALWMASRPATRNMNFGWYRAEVVGALISVLSIWVVTGILVYLAVERIINGNFEIEGGIMVITAGIGVIVNIIMGVALQVGGVPHGHGHSHGGNSHSHNDSHKDSHDNDNHSHNKDNHSHNHNKGDKKNHENSDKRNINVRAAFIHVVGDFFQSLGVLIAAIIIYFKPTWTFIDPICTFLFSILVLITTFNIIKDALNVLMEGMPKGIDFLEVQRTLFETEGVIKVHNLRIWSLSLDKIALAAHLAIGKDANPKTVLKRASRLIRTRYNIYEMTIQVEEYNDDMIECNKCQDPIQ